MSTAITPSPGTGWATNPPRPKQSSDLSTADSHPSLPRSRSGGRRRLTDEILRRFDLGGGFTNYWRLIHTLQSQSTLLSRAGVRNDGDQVERIAEACFRLAAFRSRWCRDPEHWVGCCPTLHQQSPHQQWDAFVSHLLHAYEMPTFFAQIWLQRELDRWQRDLHLHLAMGQSLRTFCIPGIGKISKRAAHCFLTAPSDATPAMAIRWGQVIAGGGSEKLARVVMSAIPISDEVGWESVWKSVIEFLLRIQDISLDEVRQIIAFIHAQRFTPARITIGRWMGEAPVAQEVNLQGWSLPQLRRWMVNWDAEHHRPTRTRPGSQPWTSAGYEPFEEQQGGAIWQLVELCTAEELRVEGGIMQHCVGSYHRYCRNGTSSIWSLRCEQGNQMRRVATIEVRPATRTLVQAKGPRNARPKPQALSVIRAWARRERIDF